MQCTWIDGSTCIDLSSAGLLNHRLQTIPRCWFIQVSLHCMTCCELPSFPKKQFNQTTVNENRLQHSDPSDTLQTQITENNAQQKIHELDAMKLVSHVSCMSVAKLLNEQFNKQAKNFLKLIGQRKNNSTSTLPKWKPEVIGQLFLDTLNRGISCLSIGNIVCILQRQSAPHLRAC